METPNLAGQRFGSLTVVSKVKRRSGGGASWVCVCDCGQSRVINTYKLYTIKTISCGCRQRQHFPSDGDLTGQVFSDLTVIARGPVGHRRNRRWICRCVCGNETTATTVRLKNGGKKSCGCLRSARGRIEMIGKQFGWLRVLATAPSRRRGSKLRVMYRVLCTRCGKETEAHGDSMRNGASVSCGCYRDEAAERVLRGIYPHSTIEQVRDYLTVRNATRKVEQWLTQTK